MKRQHLFMTVLTCAVGLGMANSTVLADQPINLSDFGAFFVGGKTIPTRARSATQTATPGRVVVNQMFVEYYIPKGGPAKAPVVMVHGSNHTGMTWMTTPDGREGWASYFLRNGHPVYIVDV